MTTSTHWSHHDDTILDAWLQHGYPQGQDPRHAVDAAARLRNRNQQLHTIINELLDHPDTNPQPEVDPNPQPEIEP